MDNASKHVIFKGAVCQFKLDPFGIHGVNHWHTVYWNAMQLWRMMHDEYEVPHNADWFFWNFAMLHDCCRLTDGPDPTHGIDAAKMIPQAEVERHDFNDKLWKAICHHTKGSKSVSELIGICWDADRLDLPRVGIAPNPEFMSTTPGVELALAYKMTEDKDEVPDLDKPRIIRPGW